MKTVCILSGGLDSTTLLYLLVAQEKKEDIHALSFDYGQKHSKEILYAKYHCKKLGVAHGVIDMRKIFDIFPQKSSLISKKIEVPEGHYEAENMKSTVVPNRNMIMLSIAAGYVASLGTDDDVLRIAYGAHAGDHAIYPDCRVEFIDAMKKVLELCDWRQIFLFAPFQRYAKKDILLRGLKMGVDYSKTWSCYKGGKKPCGRCGTCVERLEAFFKAGKEDPLEYQV